ncbi:hypothetical protein HFQ13_03705 [Acidithiobacillus sp. VAN18-1]|uniref:Uncharacterized protein n=1 Tax=Igneacidithiobacillus copahuensis TaxID=2724909 RepID=A0AAE3CIZ7_9PROT|nr:hypothetical protein [Igneacidithiobacillus copahuensis]MBU2787323.1 hypothetical protein [Igneacidithiobacillus copahuensis]MBU2797342.1 hypothetical protein [Acidithiobacillus sp. VAN18-2]
MSRRTAAPEQPDLLADVTTLSKFRQTKTREPRDFEGTSSPRHIRILHALLQRHRSREEIDLIAGASNGPEEVRKLREQGLEIPCYRLGVFNWDNQWAFRGLYALTHRDRKQVARVLATGKDGAVASSAGGSVDEAAAKGNLGGSHV